MTDIYPPLKALYRVTLEPYYETHINACDPFEAVDEATEQFFAECDYAPTVKHVQLIRNVEDLIHD